MNVRRLATLSSAPLLLLLVAGCASNGTPPPQYCSGAGVHIDAHFDGGNFYRCSIAANGSAQIDIRPEDERINPSPWFALRVSSAQPEALQLTFDFADDKARYWPKIRLRSRMQCGVPVKSRRTSCARMNANPASAQY